MIYFYSLLLIVNIEFILCHHIVHSHDKSHKPFKNSKGEKIAVKFRYVMFFWDKENANFPFGLTIRSKAHPGTSQNWIKDVFALSLVINTIKPPTDKGGLIIFFETVPFIKVL